ncbi:30S ribosomal protein S15 [Candidatus Gottesmanbacteria bacterium]|nr:30S ribosomal protein S15 [Candidatus Gottesmanbacteria bacterium]
MAKVVKEKKAAAKKAGKAAKAAKTSKTVKSAKPTKNAAKEDSVAAPSEAKKDIIEQFQVKQGDTGSPEVQIALLTKRIDKLVAHLKGNPSDNHSRRGLLGIVSKRRRLLNYLGKKDNKRSKDILSKLGLGK